MTDDFGHWLAGFIDGEGCFSIVQGSGYGALRCRFEINLRADDAAVLRECCRQTNVGLVRVRRGPDGGNEFVRWVVASKTECTTIVDLLDRYPLRAKKRADFAIWRDAVKIWASAVKGGRGSRNEVVWSRMATLRARLIVGRVYMPVESDDSALVPEEVAA